MDAVSGNGVIGLVPGVPGRNKGWKLSSAVPDSQHSRHAVVIHSAPNEGHGPGKGRLL